MEAYLTGTQVQVVVPMLDRDGNALTVDSVQYRVVDETGAVLVPFTTLTSFIGGDESATIVIPALENTLSIGVTRSLRVVELDCVVDSNTVRVKSIYYIETREPLQPGVNSFQTYSQAEFVSITIPNIPGWERATEAERIAALIEARLKICQLSFSQLNSAYNQNSLGALGDASFFYQMSFASTGNLLLLTPAEFENLPERFKDALKRAQIAEADIILGGDPMEKKRLEGLVSEAVGESRQSFRVGKPLQLPVSRRALSYLSFYVSFGKKIGRA